MSDFQERANYEFWQRGPINTQDNIRLDSSVENVIYKLTKVKGVIRKEIGIFQIKK